MRRAWIIVAGVGTLLSAAPRRAEALPPCAPGTLATYLALTGCAVAGVAFTAFGDLGGSQSPAEIGIIPSVTPLGGRAVRIGFDFGLGRGIPPGTPVSGGLSFAASGAAFRAILLSVHDPSAAPGAGSGEAAFLIGDAPGPTPAPGSRVVWSADATAITACDLGGRCLVADCFAAPSVCATPERLALVPPVTTLEARVLGSAPAGVAFDGVAIFLDVTAVPEPATAALVGAGLFAAAVVARRRGVQAGTGRTAG
jgi:hypothetical protein